MRALASQFRAEFTPNDRMRVELGVPFTYHGIGGVTGLDDRHRGAFNGVDFEVRYRLFDRAHAPFALTFGAEPHWARVDEIRYLNSQSRCRANNFHSNNQRERFQFRRIWQPDLRRFCTHIWALNRQRSDAAAQSYEVIG